MAIIVIAAGMSVTPIITPKVFRSTIASTGRAARSLLTPWVISSMSQNKLIHTTEIMNMLVLIIPRTPFILVPFLFSVVSIV